MSTTTVSAKLSAWLGLIRFSHTVFALPFAALATVMAFATPLPSGATPDFRWQDIVGVLLCMVFARSAAMAFNRLVDHEIDAANPRTEHRHLPAGVLSRGSVWTFTILCGLGFVASTAIFLPNWLPLAGSIPVLLFLCGYSLAKTVHVSRASLAGSGAFALPDLRVGCDSWRRHSDCTSRSPGTSGFGSRRRCLGDGVRHHLRVSGRTVRRTGGAA